MNNLERVNRTLEVYGATDIHIPKIDDWEYEDDSIEELKENQDFYNEFLVIIKPRKDEEYHFDLFVETDY
jgi:hypothetical protein